LNSFTRAFVGRDGRAFDRDADLLGRFGGVDGDLIARFVALLDAEIEIHQVDVEIGMDQLVLDHCQMIRVISSPSISTMGLATLIFAIELRSRWSAVGCRFGLTVNQARARMTPSRQLLRAL
jgi:hypothetical protein